MRSGIAFLAALLLSLSQCASSSFYLKDNWIGNDFFRDWNWETENDPTHGRVNYVSQTEAIAKNLSYVENNAFVMRADNWSIVEPSARGRDSVRISTQNAYGESIFVLDLAHMPAGCATWPAFRTKSLKGVNLLEINQATLHTTPGCQMPPDPQRQPQSGTTISTNCDATVNGNEGCGVLIDKSGPSYGTPFNMNGGGYYVMVRSRVLGIQIYFWPRDNSAYVPAEIPFDAHQILIDLTFCGDWAGNAWPSSGCGNSTCENLKPIGLSTACVYTPQRVLIDIIPSNCLLSLANGHYSYIDELQVVKYGNSDTTSVGSGIPLH
ncbi:hypothetical protein BGY98DRAFT_1176009 [Russula aff. rugulosa BPL654]|nr:hypothetical protein BGY98DRAFT_1176009 [Russula aff. rugulosa BPL654]